MNYFFLLTTETVFQFTSWLQLLNVDLKEQQTGAWPAPQNWALITTFRKEWVCGSGGGPWEIFLLSTFIKNNPQSRSSIQEHGPGPHLNKRRLYCWRNFDSICMHSQDKEQENLAWVIPRESLRRKYSGKPVHLWLYALLTRSFIK